MYKSFYYHVLTAEGTVCVAKNTVQTNAYDHDTDHNCKAVDPQAESWRFKQAMKTWNSRPPIFYFKPKASVCLNDDGKYTEVLNASIKYQITESAETDHITMASYLLHYVW